MLLERTIGIVNNVSVWLVHRVGAKERECDTTHLVLAVHLANGLPRCRHDFPQDTTLGLENLGDGVSVGDGWTGGVGTC